VTHAEGNEAPPTLAAALPEPLFRADQSPALFWFTGPHVGDLVYPPTAPSQSLNTRQMLCASPRKPLSRCFAPRFSRQ
jgi:hypothetical protein